MALEWVFGIILLAIVVFIAMRIVGSVAVGIMLIGLIFIASYLILGTVPSLKSVPIVGQFLPEFPTTGEAIAIVRNVFFNLDIIGTSADANGNLLITVANTGKLDVSGFKVFVNNQTASILNQPKDPLKSKETTIIQTGWKGEFNSIIVETKQARVSHTQG